MTRPSVILPRNLSAARTQARLSREQVATEIGKSWATVRAYELGAATPPLDVLSALADTFGVTVAALIGEPPGEQSTAAPARPAEKGTNTPEIDSALVRIAVTGVVAAAAADGHTLRRKAARAVVLAHIKGEPTPQDLSSENLTPAQMDAYLRKTFAGDPTGVTAVRNAARGGVVNV